MSASRKEYVLNREAMRRWLGGAKVSERVLVRLCEFVTANGHETLPRVCPPLSHDDRVSYMKRLKPIVKDDGAAPNVETVTKESPKSRKRSTPELTTSPADAENFIPLSAEVVTPIVNAAAGKIRKPRGNVSKVLRDVTNVTATVAETTQKENK